MSSNKDFIKRIANDVKYIYNNKIDGVYYKHDEENLLLGRAMIIGPKNTPYSFGFYFFEFNFSTNYPYEPPKVTYLTNDGYTRFHPNLYSNGKVCLSLLNTWSGEGWTSCQNITSILLTFLTILDENPLLHEPGVYKNNKYIQQYNEIINYMNLKFSIIELYNKLNTLNINNLETSLDKILYYFSNDIIFEFKKNYNDIHDYIELLLREKKNIIINEFFYNKNRNINIDYNLIFDNFKQIKI